MYEPIQDFLLGLTSTFRIQFGDLNDMTDEFKLAAVVHNDKQEAGVNIHKLLKFKEIWK